MATSLSILQPQPAEASFRPWIPRQVYVTRAAATWEYGQTVAQRAQKLGAQVEYLSTDRLPRIQESDKRRAYAAAKTTLAITVAPPGKLKLQPIPPSADWQFHIAEGCPAHCQYCYLAGSLQGAPLTRVYANLAEILANLENYLGKGGVTSQSKHRADEGTTFEASCYTDPLALEHLTGGLAESIRFFGKWKAPVQLRWTTKFDAVGPLLKLDHQRRTRVRFSVNAEEVQRTMEGGTPRMERRLAAMRQVALAGYPIGLTIAPIMPIPSWEAAYLKLIEDTARVLAEVDADLTVELITHRFTPGSKEVLNSWYPRSPLEMNEEQRSEKWTKFGSIKYVYPKVVMKELRNFFEDTITRTLPSAKILYWT